MTGETIRIGIDLGGTKIAAVALDRAGDVRHALRVDTPASNYEATVEAIAALVEDTERALGEPGTVGVATPGARSLATGLMKNANSTCLNGRALKEDLEARIAREVRLENDANCFALSEAVDGAARDAPVVFGVILGTGVGGGIVVDGQVVTGANAIGGEWGHNPLPLAGPGDHPLPPCYCGRRGCIETYLSGPGLARDHERVTGQSLDAAEIARRAREGDEGAGATLARHEERLARSLAGVINLLDPHVIVLGGGLSRMVSLYGNVPRLWQAHVFSDEIRTRLAAPAHGDTSGVRGAAWLWGGPPRKPPTPRTTDRP
jgi:predicted NBD/HSP70 family sugar kinase